jgi:hypothetical protein
MAEPQKHAEKQAPQQFTREDIEVLNLVHPAGFDSEAQTLIAGRNITAALETPNGVLVQRYVARGGQQERYLIPWANIRSVKYATAKV